MGRRRAVVSRLVYIIGEPGVGKTTALEIYCGRFFPVDDADPIPHRAWLDRDRLAFVTLGRHRPPFSGTDTLSLGIQPRAVAWLTSPGAPDLVIAEGDRLANAKFFDAIVDSGRRLDVVHLTLDPATAEARRDARGSTQDPAWIKGRRTKVERLSRDYWATLIDTDRPARDVADDLRHVIESDRG